MDRPPADELQARPTPKIDHPPKDRPTPHPTIDPPANYRSFPAKCRPPPQPIIQAAGTPAPDKNRSARCLNPPRPSSPQGTQRGQE
eukprot:scaffold16301_cov71-Isochrysis_galbana.AAC.2